jgi:hypothetical protein
MRCCNRSWEFLNRRDEDEDDEEQKIENWAYGDRMNSAYRQQQVPQQPQPQHVMHHQQYAHHPHHQQHHQPFHQHRGMYEDHHADHAYGGYY